jgi:hypothetical protein
MPSKMPVIVKFKAEDIRIQRAARKMVVHERRVIQGVMMVGFLLLLIMAVVLSPRYPVYLVILPVVLFYLVMRVVINWRQWQALLVNQVKCPSCNALVADRVHLMKPPNSNCPHCGKRAQATLEQLEDKK